MTAHVTDSVTADQLKCDQSGYSRPTPLDLRWGMANQFKNRDKSSAKGRQRPLSARQIYPREWRNHFGISAEDIAEAMEIERESVLRMERDTDRMTPSKQAAYAQAIGTLPENLWRKPKPSDVPIREGLAIAAERITSKTVTK